MKIQLLLKNIVAKESQPKNNKKAHLKIKVNYSLFQIGDDIQFNSVDVMSQNKIYPFL